MKIVLVDPSPYRSFSVVKPYEHLGLGYLGAVLRDAGYDVQLFSSVLERKNERRTVSALLEIDADVIGFSVKEIFARETINVVKGLRKAGCTAKIIFGGHYPTFNHEILLNTFPEIDFIVRGEGEYILLNLIRALEGKGCFNEIAGLTFRQAEQVVANDAVQHCLDVDNLLFPLRDYAPKTIADSGEIAIAASRGCYANCSFCSIQTFYRGLKGKHYRRRSNDNILAEIEQLMQQFDCNSFNFVDDQFIPPGAKGQEVIESFADEIIRRGLKIEFQCMTRVNDISEESLLKLKAAGLKSVFIGIESGHQRGLDTFNKGTTVEQNRHAMDVLDKVGIGYTAAFIMVDPYTTFRELMTNLDFLVEAKPRVLKSGGLLSVEPAVTPHIGTAIHTQLARENRLRGNFVDGYHYRTKDINVFVFLAIWRFLENIILPIIFFIKEKANTFFKLFKKSEKRAGTLKTECSDLS